ncbi:MAG: hypothetical protein Q8R25_03065 [bacterium]|nr:hypothetical protein [bacterium]
MDDDQEFQKLIDERLAQLPKVVQDAIHSADVTQNLRKLANTHKLHVDQWEALEEIVQYTLLGFKSSDDLAQNIQSEVGVTTEVAHTLATDIGTIVFEPIRQELERGLDHPDAKAEKVSTMETSRTQILKDEHAAETPSVSKPVVAPATPPPPPPTKAANRTPVDPSYISSVPSHERPTIEGDPYREQTG